MLLFIKKNYGTLLFLYLFVVTFVANAMDHHVICVLKKNPKTKAAQNISNHNIHEATHKIIEICNQRYNHHNQDNHHYPHRNNSVFLVHFDHGFNNWTLYKPSSIDYNQFVKLIKKVYAQHHVSITCHQDQMVNIATSHDKESLSGTYVTLDEFEKYKKLNDVAIQSSTHDTSSEKIEKMKKYFFWHLQIPTTGLLREESFDVDDAYKPLAWHFLLWDLAPKKGQGAHVAIIDTGASAFNVEEKEFADMYKKNINISFPDNLNNYGYNLVSQNGLDPIRQIAINFGYYCDHEKFNSDSFLKKLPEWIIDFEKNKNKSQFEQYFIENAKKRYLNNECTILNEQGCDVLKDLLYGKHGIAPLQSDSFFHTVHVQAPYNQEVILETLPTPKINDNESPFSAGHGTFTQGVVNGQTYNELGITGLAPQAHVVMIKAFNDCGTTNKTTLNAALQRAIAVKSSIVSMSLKITDEVDKVADAPLKALIDSIDYVVAASGNDGQSKKLKNKEAYPAKFDSVAFDVGAFEYNDGSYTICPFTQMEKNIGPKIVAPGFNLFSSGITPHQTQDSMYLFMTGTSIAVPVITGFLALVIAEFQDIFTREQILKVIYTFSLKLSGDDLWQKSIICGTPDMRSALLCLHVLKSLKNKLQDNTHYTFEDHFDNLVQAVYTINYYTPSCYEHQMNCSFTQNFEKYKKLVETEKPVVLNAVFYTPHDVASCVEYLSGIILQAIDPKKYNDIKISDHNDLMNSLTIVTDKKFNLFSTLSNVWQTRIKGALAERNVCCLSSKEESV